MAHFNKLQFSNFRAFQEPVTIDFSEITVLTGANNSGKSSFLKALQVLKNNLQLSVFSDLNFAQGTHNLGDFNSTKNKDTPENSINISLVCTTDVKENNAEENNAEEKVCFDLRYAPFPNFTEKAYLKGLNLGLIHGEQYYNILEFNCNFNNHLPFDERIEVHINLQNFIEKKNNKYNYLFDENELRHKLAASAYELSSLSSSIDDDITLSLEGKANDMHPSRFPAFLEANINTDLWNWLFEEDFWESEEGQSFFEAYNGREIDEDEDEFDYRYKAMNYVFDDILNLNSVASDIHEWITLKLDNLLHLIQNIHHLGAFRGESKRIYGFSESHSIDAILFDLGQRYDMLRSNEKAFLNKWLSEFGIGDELVVQRLPGIGTIVKIKSKGKEYSLADLGFAYAQLLPIIIKTVLIANESVEKLSTIEFDLDFGGAKKPKEPKKEKAYTYNTTLLLLEEPESHLHPKLQSQLADFFGLANNLFNIHFIVETHSEYLIHKLRYLVLTKEIKPQSVNIYYIDGLNAKASERIKNIRIRQDGTLTNDFGGGFVDESSRWMELLKVSPN